MIKPSQAAAQRELQKRAAAAPRPLELDPRFAKQNKFVRDLSRFVVAQCSRRAGKSNGLAIRFFETMSRHPKSNSVYLALTVDSARDIMWPVLQELNDRFKLGCTMLESKLMCRHPNGATLKLLGADMKNFIKRLKGRKFPGVAVDEAQDFGSHLRSLIDDVLTPSIADYTDGWLALTGTPGPVPNGYFFDITQQGKYGYSLHKWTLYDNPYMPNPKKFVEELKRKREWDDSNPTLRREYYNQWVLDTKSLWIQYDAKLNHYGYLPEVPGVKWNYILGIDIGFKDADALAVLAWNEKSPATYLVTERVVAKQGITELARQIEELDRIFHFSKMVIDEGGLGKKIAEEIRRQKHIPVQAADKLRKQETVEFLNDAMRTGRFLAKSASRFAQDSYLVQIDWEKSTPDKIVVKKQPHSDIIDAVIYAFKESPAFTYQAERVTPAVGTSEWCQQQETEMFERELERLLEEQEREDIYKP